MQSNQNIPQHVAIIMDGNGRWAKKRGMERFEGHRQGVESLRQVVETASKCGISYLTVYAFSTENWTRPQDEVNSIMELFSTVMVAEAQNLAQKNVRLTFIGNTAALTPPLQQQMAQVQKIEIEQIEMTLVVAINYSARWDITNAMRQINSEKLISIDETIIRKHLSTAALPDVDLLIRTSGEQRLSNFMLWELSYAELYFTQTLWPDFLRDEFLCAIDWYKSRCRRYGAVE